MRGKVPNCKIILDPDEFEINAASTRMARCRLCPNTKWVNFGNAQKHAGTTKHLGRTKKKNYIIKTDYHCSAAAEEIHEDPGSTIGFQEPLSSYGAEDALLNSMNIDDFAFSFLRQVDGPQLFNGPVNAMNEELPLEDSLDEWTPDVLNEEIIEPQQEFDPAVQNEPNTLVDETLPNRPYRDTTKCLGHDDWAPYPSKAMFLTDLLFNSPRLRFSELQKKAILRWAKDLGAQDVPTLSSLKGVQDALRTAVGDPTAQKNTHSGSLFYINKINSAIAKDLANPFVRPHLVFYPERCEDGKMTQTWHGTKWLCELPDEMLTPMAIHPNGQHFYVGELCERRDGSLFIPQRWFLKEGNGLWASGVNVEQTPAGLFVDSQCPREFALEELQLNYIKLKEQRDIKFADESMAFSEKMPNPKRTVAAGRPYYTVLAMIFVDDVSGNVSKQWNKHYVCYMSNACLPREQLNEEFNVRFVSSSPHISALELAQGVCDSFREATEGSQGYDCLLRAECVFRVVPYIKAADNPMHAEFCSHCGLTANKFCRTCDVGGTQLYKRSDEGYLKLFECGKIRTPEETKDAIHQQFTRALQPRSQTAIEKLVKDTGIKDGIAQPFIQDLMQAANELVLKDRLSKPQIQLILEKKYGELRKAGQFQNPFLELPGSNIHLDCPTEILHTILLGAVKYFWGQTVYLIIKSKKLQLFQARLASISADGLNIPRINASYMCQYRGSLIGKHFKTIVQVLPMVIYDLVHTDLFDAWLLLAQLTVLCWHTEIKNIDSYINELDSVVDQFLTKAAVCAPSIIITKPKFHFLTHLGLYIRRFGPALLFATERYESFNSVFRLSQIHSNRMAPSRDTARTFADLDRLQHIISGGYWYDVSAKQYIQASPHVRQVVASTPEYEKLVGFPKKDTRVPGSTTLLPLNKEEKKKRTRKAVAWAELPIASINGYHRQFSSGDLFYRGQSIITKNKDVARLGSTVVVKDSANYILGRVIEILITHMEAKCFIFLQLFKFETPRHPKFDFPILTLTKDYKQVEPKDLTCVVNVQHDCSSSGCDIAATAPVFQERQQTTCRKTMVVHKDDYRFILNTLSLHNYQILKEVLPETLAASRIYYSDTEQKATRIKMAAQARDKKNQQKEAREATQREVALGRATKELQPANISMDSSENEQPESDPTFQCVEPPSSHQVTILNDNVFNHQLHTVDCGRSPNTLNSTVGLVPESGFQMIIDSQHIAPPVPVFRPPILYPYDMNQYPFAEQHEDASQVTCWQASGPSHTPSAYMPPTPYETSSQTFAPSSYPPPHMIENSTSGYNGAFYHPSSLPPTDFGQQATIPTFSSGNYSLNIQQVWRGQKLHEFSHHQSEEGSME